MTGVLRPASPNDVPALLEIYAPYVLETSISFETEVPSLEDMRSRVRQGAEFLPWIVYEHEGVVLGYAYAGPFRSRAAYSKSVESTVYVRRGHHGRGIALPNDASVALHESLGFEKVAHLKRIGFKHGQWWDVGYWQLQMS